MKLSTRVFEVDQSTVKSLVRMHGCTDLFDFIMIAKSKYGHCSSRVRDSH